MIWKLVDHEGRITLRSDDPYPDYTRPIRRALIWPGPLLNDDWRDWLTSDDLSHYRQVGGVYDIPGGVKVSVYFGNGSWHSFACDWNTRATWLEIPIPAPRDGSTYTWTWAGGKWVKQDYPLCRDCDALHHPALPYCSTAHQLDTDGVADDCGYHHKPGRHVQRQGWKLVARKT